MSDVYKNDTTVFPKHYYVFGENPQNAFYLFVAEEKCASNSFLPLSMTTIYHTVCSFV